MKKSLLTLVLSMTITGFVSPLASATEPPMKDIELHKKNVLDSASMELRNKLNVYNHFAANFSQTVVDNKGQEIQQATGSMKMSQPNMFRWVTNEPDESVVVSDGQSVWIYNPFVEQVSAMDLDSTMTQSPLWLIANQSDEAWLLFDVIKNGDRFEVMPKDAKNLTKKIVMSFSDNKIAELDILDAQGQTSHFVFNNFDYQTAIDADVFTFDMPEGVDFDDQRGAK
ncbi:MAG: outer membrane lipoprotein carrier protein LolA [Gammaproteobacteria bacterium MedPE]|nr:MAG: outer membrane lipoprotein carrier protein LolA [Gammaproteobacteria bacterium MedPE]